MTLTRLFVPLLGVATLLRLIAVFTIPWQPAFDDAWYFRTASQIAAGLGYLDDFGRKTAFFPVGYPATLSLVMSAFGSTLRVAQLLNIIFSVATMASIYWLARNLKASVNVSALAAGLFGYLPNQIVSCCITMSEITFTLALTLGIALSVGDAETRPKWRWVVAGLVFGWATLIRPQALVVPVLLIAGSAVLRGGIRGARHAIVPLLLTGFGLVVVVAPWTLRNYRVFDQVVLVSSNGGENLLIGNNPKSTQNYSPPARFYPEGLDLPRMNELDRDRMGKQMAIEYLREHPIQALLRTPKKVWYMYRSDLGVTNWIWEQNGKRGTALYYLTQGLTQLGYLAVLLSGFYWMFLALRRVRSSSTEERVRLFVIACPIVYFTLITMVFFGDARYHQPIMPSFAIAAALAITSLRRRSAQAPALS